MIEIGRRRRNQPAPPQVIFDALVDPDCDPTRPWLDLLDDEQRPRIIRADRPATVVWSSLWSRRPDAVVRFDLPRDGGSGTDLCWTLWVKEPRPDDVLTVHLRKRVNRLINANLRYTFKQ